MLWLEGKLFISSTSRWYTTCSTAPKTVTSSSWENKSDVLHGSTCWASLREMPPDKFMDIYWILSLSHSEVQVKIYGDEFVLGLYRLHSLLNSILYAGNKIRYHIVLDDLDWWGCSMYVCITGYRITNLRTVQSLRSRIHFCVLHATAGTLVGTHHVRRKQKKGQAGSVLSQRFRT